MPIELLGTAHISPQSVKDVTARIQSGKYSIVAVELDRQRAHMLLSGTRPETSFFALVRAVGFSGAILARVGHWASKKLGMRVGVMPGEDMRTAIVEASKQKIPVALIDRPIQITLQKFSKAFTFKEKLGLLLRGFRKTDVKLNIAGTPDQQTVQKLIQELKRISPAIYDVLVAQRDAYMAKRLIAVVQREPQAHILAVVGAGHVPGITKLLEDYNNRITKEQSQNA